MELFGEYDIRVNPNRKLEVQLEDVADQMMEAAEDDGYTRICLVVIDNGRQETVKTVYVYVDEGEVDE